MSRSGLHQVLRELARCYEAHRGLVYETWSCYLSERYHCGRCESRRSRHRAFKETGIPDCTRYLELSGDPEEFVKVEDYYVHRSCPGRLAARGSEPTRLPASLPRA